MTGSFLARFSSACKMLWLRYICKIYLDWSFKKIWAKEDMHMNLEYLKLISYSNNKKIMSGPGAAILNILFKGEQGFSQAQGTLLMLQRGNKQHVRKDYEIK